MVNRCGHGISYTQLEEIDTALYIQKMNAAESEDKVPLPDNIHPHVSTTLAWDNIWTAACAEYTTSCSG